MIDPFSRPVFNRARRLCLALPEASEKTAWGHPTFRIADKLSMLYEGKILVTGKPADLLHAPFAPLQEFISMAGLSKGQAPAGSGATP